MDNRRGRRLGNAVAYSLVITESLVVAKSLLVAKALLRKPCQAPCPTPKASSTARSKSSSRRNAAARCCLIPRIAGGSTPRLSCRHRGSILQTLRRSEDSFVGELIEGVIGRGHPGVRAHFPRCYVDVNREPYELDPRMFDGRLPSFANTRSMRVAGGLGTVARVVGDAQEIYDQRIAVGEALRRIEGLYKPYHRTLRRLFMRLQRDFGAAILVDCHSMPSATGGRDERPRADLVLGDRYGTSCVGIVAETIEHCMREFGYSVSRNKPYAGGFITEHDGNPTTGLHVIQLEINRALYMDGAATNARNRSTVSPANLKYWHDCPTEIPLEELRPYRAAAE